MQQSLYGYHLLMDERQMSNDQFERILAHMTRLNSAVVNCKTEIQAHQLSPADKVWQRVDAIRAALPDTMIILRIWPDDGIWLRMTPAEHWRQKAAPIADWLRTQNIKLLADNESVTDDMTPYAAWHAELMHLYAEQGVGLAVGRTATGNPAHHHYEQMDVMWLTLAQYPDLHVYSPNEYYDLGRDNDLVGRYKRAWARFDYYGRKRPVTTIGEFGLAVNLDPHNGWQGNIDERKYAQQVIDYARHMYDGVPLAIYSYPDWDNTGFGVGEAFMSELEQNPAPYRVHNFPVAPPLSVDDPRWIEATARPKEAWVTIRVSPTVNSAQLTRLTEATNVHTIPQGEMTETERQYVNRADGTWYPVKLPDNRIGYGRNDYLIVENLAPEPQPEPSEYVTQAEFAAWKVAMTAKLEEYVTWAAMTEAIDALLADSIRSASRKPDTARTAQINKQFRMNEDEEKTA